MPAASADPIARIKSEAAVLPRPPRLMEVCGTHTEALFRHGIRELLGDALEIVSGPGCPVCVTSDAAVDAMVAYARQGHIVATFGDMIRVPGTETSLAGVRAEGADVRVVTSPLQTLEMARTEPGRRVVFLAVGFETTAPGTALLLAEAKRSGLENLYVFSAHKLIPPAMRALLDAGDQRISGFLCPGHVSAVIGLAPYEPISGEYRTPCVVSGFEPGDILQSLFMLVRQLRAGRAEVENQYTRAVRPEGNPRARALLAEVFIETDSDWRGLGRLRASGLALRGGYRRFDAAVEMPVEVPPPRTAGDRRCGEVLRGLLVPGECPLFAADCTPDTPRGPCMVSREGACGIYYANSGQKLRYSQP